MKKDISHSPAIVVRLHVLLFCIISVSVPASALETPSRLVSNTGPGSLDDMARAAEGNFTPISDRAICQAKNELQRAAASLDSQFQKVGPNGKGWEKYLGWDDLKSTIASDKPDMDRLKKAYSALAASHRGLELACFVDLRLAMEKYMNLRLAADSSQIKVAYDKLLAGFPEMLKDYTTRPTSDPSAPLQKVTTWLDQFEQAPALLAKLRAHFAKPNFHASLSKRLIAPGLEGTVEEPVDVCDVILQTRVHSQGIMSGQKALQLVPSENEALLEVRLTGMSQTESHGRRGMVRIYSDANSQIAAIKRIKIDADGLSTTAAGAHVDTSTTIRSVCTNSRCGLIQNIARNKVYQSKHQAEAIAARRAEQRVARQVNEQADPAIARANKNYQHQFRSPLLHRKLFPSWLDFSTTMDRLNIVALQQGLAQFAAWSDPPEVDQPQADAVVRIHESAVNNSTWTFLAGRTFAEEEFLSIVSDLYHGKVPEALQSDEDKEPWAITFAQDNPIRVIFDSGNIRAEIHASGFTKGDNSYTAMNVAATYKLDSKDGRLVLTRLGDLEVFPPGFEEENRKLSVREQTLRRLLEKRFAKIFTPEWTPENIKLPEPWKSAGSLQLTHWQTENGWLTMSWQLEEQR